jgi:hypothetical protein
MKYSLEEIEEMLIEPSFDIGRWCERGEILKAHDIINLLEEAIEYHEQLSNDNNAEHQ